MYGLGLDRSWAVQAFGGLVEKLDSDLSEVLVLLYPYKLLFVSLASGIMPLWV